MTIKEIRALTGLSQTKFGEKYGGIPLRTIQGWELEERKCPDYVVWLIERAVRQDLKES